MQIGEKMQKTRDRRSLKERLGDVDDIVEYLEIWASSARSCGGRAPCGEYMHDILYEIIEIISAYREGSSKCV